MIIRIYDNKLIIYIYIHIICVCSMNFFWSFFDVPNEGPFASHDGSTLLFLTMVQYDNGVLQKHYDYELQKTSQEKKHVYISSKKILKSKLYLYLKQLSKKLNIPAWLAEFSLEKMLRLLLFTVACAAARSGSCSKGAGSLGATGTGLGISPGPPDSGCENAPNVKPMWI